MPESKEPTGVIISFAPSCKRRHTEGMPESRFHSQQANQEPDDDDFDCCPGCRSLRQEQLEERVMAETATSRASFPLPQPTPHRTLLSWLRNRLRFLF
jgi:hypothetical protein